MWPSRPKPDNLVTGDTNGAADVFVHDRQTAKTARVSAPSMAQPVTTDSDSPSISGDGRFVAFSADPSYPKYMYTTARHRAPIRLSTIITPMRARPSISSDGRFVAYEDLASTL